MKTKKLIGSLMLLLAAFVWGLAYSIQGITSKTLGSFTVTMFKGLGGIVLIPIAIKLKEHFDSKTIISGVLIGFVVFLGSVLQQEGISMSTASKASFITALYIIEVPIISLLLGKKQKPTIWLATLVAIVGMYFLCFTKGFVLQIGDILLLMASLCFAVQIILTEKYAGKCDVIALATVQQMTTGLLSAAIALVLEKPSVSQMILVWPNLLYTALLAGALAQTIQVIYQKDIEASLASLLMSLESVFGALGGWLILNQALSFKELLGCGLIFISILIAEK